MNRVRVTAAMLVLVLQMGCPVGGEEGVLHQALLKDRLEALSHKGCPYADIKVECGPNPESVDACMQNCLEVLARKRK